MSAADPRALLRKHGLDAKRSWGQNFLVDRRIHAGIAREAGAAPGRRVIEIGAGLGTLTAHLLAAGAEVTAIERDRDLVEVLRAELGGEPRLRLVEANALTFDYAAEGRGLTVVGNLPYQIASPLLFRLLEAATRPHVERIVVMVQREVAERMAAAAATPAYGGLSVMCQALAEVTLCFRVKPGAFFPPPRVESAVVRLAPRAVIGADERALSAVVRAAFGQRRKTLRNALGRLLPAETLAALGVDPARRGETLALEEFLRLARALPAGAAAVEP